MAKRQIEIQNLASLPNIPSEGPNLLDEIWLQIFSLLPPSNVLGSVSNINRRFLGLSSNEGMWNKFCVAESKVPKGSCQTWKQRYFFI